MNKKKQKISPLVTIVLLYCCTIVFSLLIVNCSLFANKVFASSFTYDITTTYTINDDYITIQEAKSITNNTVNRYIPASETTTFFIPQYENTDNQSFEKTLNSIETYPSYHTIEQVNGGYEVSISFGSDLNEGETINFTLEYKDYQLMDIVGNVKIFIYPKSFSLMKVLTKSNKLHLYGYPFISLKTFIIIWPLPIKLKTKNT